MADISQRIDDVIREKSLSQKDFAAAVGFTPGYINDILRGRTTPSIRVVERMTRAFDVSADWLLTGKGPKYGERRVRYQSEKIEVVTPKELVQRGGKFGKRKHDFVAVPVLSQSMLSFLPVNDEDTAFCAPDEYCIVPHGWVKRPKTIFCCRVNDPRMGPAMPMGSIAAVDTSIRAPSRINGKLCAIMAEPTPVIRRLHITRTHLSFETDDDKDGIKPIRVKIGADNPIIIGKVEWVHNLRE